MSVPRRIVPGRVYMVTRRCTERRRWENFWASEATSVVELVGPDDILDKMTYALTNPVKDGLIDRAHHCHGASSLSAHLTARTIARPPVAKPMASTTRIAIE